MPQLKLGAVLRAMQTAYADLIRDFITDRVRSRTGRLLFALVVLIVGALTGGNVLVQGYAEGSALVRVVAVVAAASWVLGFGHTAALIARR
ncbi:MAG: hypothetical protein HOU81_12880 [Hamadaea sp.]|uniref:hypothetical protein n=1 Tax=Hamadaea sp. TaxID=2024425 RepID=UPI00185AA07F|nr:hypothetical protein [Hamadaea sp.]NUR71709.1 hypothetical protein [Hamadaea sp.]NUT19023.1 hypothetical protein [Hamadaea sp.]